MDKTMGIFDFFKPKRKKKFSIFSYQIHKFEKKHIVWEFAMSKNHIDEPDVYLDFIFTIENGEIKNVSIDD